MKLIKTTTALSVLLMTSSVWGQEITFTSSPEQTTMIELYTSEGCSSCPPADQFLSQFQSSDEIWTKYIPMAFHVDYWDYIGWNDVFASSEFSNRQRSHKRQGNISSVYTPGFVANGLEWTGFFKLWRALPEPNKSPGVLTLEVDRHLAKVSFPSSGELKFNLAVLGMGLVTEVKSGENAGHQLSHDFVVLNHQSASDKQQHTFNLPLILKHKPEQFSLVAWVSKKDSLKPIQAVGGFLPDGIIKKL